jgi:uncharacterized small protein (DUF1192 family)
MVGESLMRIIETIGFRGVALAVLSLPLLISGGCATLNESECRSLDWQIIGYEDGGRGQALERIGQHRKACAKYGISPDLTAYQRGRETGLREYCRPASGFRVGVAGRSYTGVCPIELEEDFLGAYESGQHLYELRAHVTGIESRIDSKHDELERATDELAKTSATLIASDSTPERRAQALLDAKQLAEEVGRLKSEIDHLETERALSESDVESYRATVRYTE